MDGLLHCGRCVRLRSQPSCFPASIPLPSYPVDSVLTMPSRAKNSFPSPWPLNLTRFAWPTSHFASKHHPSNRLAIYTSHPPPSQAPADIPAAPTQTWTGLCPAGVTCNTSI